MNPKYLRVCVPLALLTAAVACDRSNPTNPTTVATLAPSAPVMEQPPASFTDLKTGITLIAPTLVTPTAGQQFQFSDQPLTLTIKNGVTTGTTPLTYLFQVASDAGFSTLVYTKDAVAAGAGGQTKITIDTLPGPAAKSYFWRARASAGSVIGPFTTARSFSVGPQVVLQTPVPTSPASGTTLSGTLALTVTDVGRTGPVGPITYKFDLSNSSSFSQLLFTQTVAEQSGSTTVTVSNSVTAGLYYWRVQAIDAVNGVSSPSSPVISFTFQPFTMSQAIIEDSPTDLASWAETAKITSISISPDAFLVDFDKRDGPDRWPDTPFGSGSIEYTLGMCGNLGGQWYCSAVVQFWYGRDLAASTPPSYVGQNWFYDSRWGALQGYQPADGETVGIFVGAGNLRDRPLGDQSYVKERSNVAFVQWSNDSSVNYTFSAGKLIAVKRKR